MAHLLGLAQSAFAGSNHTSGHSGGKSNPITLNYWQLFIGYVIYNNMIYLPSIIMFLLQFVNIRYYVINSDRERFRRVCKILEKETYSYSCKHVNGRDIPSGYFIGRNCIGQFANLNSFNEDDKIYLICRKDFYKMLTADKSVAFGNTKTELVGADRGAWMATKAVDGVDTETQSDGSDPEVNTAALLVKKTCSKKTSSEPTVIKKYNRHGRYKNFYYHSMDIDITHINPIGDQLAVRDDILQIFKKKGRATVFIHGITLAGKSSIGYLVAKSLKGHFCHSFNPTDPGDNFANLISEMTNSRDEESTPIVIVLEEANEMIKAAHTKTTLKVDGVPTPVRDKTSWCTFLDDMAFYKDVILILTSNEPKDDLDALDPAYLNKGRIHGTFSMMKQLAIEDIN